MGYTSYGKLWRSEFYNIESAKDRLQDINHNQLKLKVTEFCMKDEKITTNFKPSNDEDVLIKIYLGTKLAESLSEVKGLISVIEKNYN